MFQAFALDTMRIWQKKNNKKQQSQSAKSFLILVLNLKTTANIQYVSTSKNSLK